MTAFLRTLRAALSLLVLRRPRTPAGPLGAGAFWGAAALVAALGALDDFLATDSTRVFETGGFAGFAFHALLALALGGVAAKLVARRPRLHWLAAGLIALLVTFAEYAVRPIESDLLAPVAAIGAERASALTDALWALWVAAALFRALRWIAPDRGIAVRLVAAGLLAAGVIAPRYAVPTGDFFSAPEAEESEDEPEAQPESASFDTEQVMAAQPALLAEKLANLAPQRPGQVDAYFVAFGGDADQDVFRNEVEYAQKLFEQRFGAAGRTLVLLNHADTTATTPLATRTNLAESLAAIGRIIDRDEDIVMVFLTSHGNPDDHSVYVKLGALPLHDVTPADLRVALDRAGIKHRVVVVSACYSGAFVPALRDDHTMVIAAARADRPSFGCSSESELTYFGHAFLVDALNRTEDFHDAFVQARAEIEKWEAEEDQKHSYPQIASAPAIDRQLERWRAQLHAGFPVPFRPARESAESLIVPSAAGTPFAPRAPSTENR